VERQELARRLQTLEKRPGICSHKIAVSVVLVVAAPVFLLVPVVVHIII